MKTIKWLINLVNVKPVLFCVAILLIAITTLTSVIIERNNKVNHCENEKIELKADYERRIDTLHKKLETSDAEVKAILNSIIANYKQELKEQKEINSEIEKVINKNRFIIRKSKQNEQ